MTADMSGASLPAQARVAEGIKTVLTSWLDNSSVPSDNLIV
jgi:hypothetical protein